MTIWNCAVATPDPASAELDVTFTALPRTFAAATGAVTDPVGAVESTVNVTALVAVFPAASATVTVYVPGVDGALDHDNVRRHERTARGRGDGLGRVRPSRGRLHRIRRRRRPEPASVTAATRRGSSPPRWP